MRPSNVPSPATWLRLATCLGAVLVLPAAAAAESAASELDAELEAIADPAEVAPGGTSTVRILLRNRGGFGMDDGVVGVRLPATLELISAEPARGTYDAETGEWTTGEVLSFDVVGLTLTVQAAEGASSPTVTAEVMSIVGSFEAYDRDSTPGNGDPCEDDQASVTITVTGGADAGAGDPDAGAACPEPPDAGPGNDRPDAGPPDAAVGPGAADAGGGGNDGDGCGCSGTADRDAPGALALALAAILSAHLARRRRASRALSRAR